MKSLLRLFILTCYLTPSFIIGQSEFDFPKSVLGYDIGDRFTRHAELIDYFEKLQSKYPENIILNSYGETYENRQLIYLIIGNKKNIANIKSIQENHVNGKDEQVGIVWLSYNVHGNESSGSEAAMQTAYELMLKKNASFLENTVIIMDPCMNPDGRERYVNFYHQFGSKPLNLNVNSVEHNEIWPGGRSNHYFFDLNRDWAWMTQKESENRVKLFNCWLPHIHVDFHEQGINEPYYFPPAAEPYHEVVTEWQRAFQVKIGQNHAKHFDKEGWLYFSKEIFDLLYPSYGDTYPMFSGSIGMTYEQGGSHRGGLAVINKLGDTLRLKDRVKHHVRAGISTIETASKNSSELIKEFQKFNNPDRFKYKSFIISGKRQKLNALLELLDKNSITYARPNTKIAVKGFDYNTQKNTKYLPKDTDYLVSVKQHKGALVEALFEPKTILSDSLTYDISAWTLPYAYGVNCIASESFIDSEYVKNEEKIKEKLNLPLSYGYVIEWNSMNSARFLTEVLKEGFRVRYSIKPFEKEGIKYIEGSLIILNHENDEQNYLPKLSQIVKKYDVDIHIINSGFMDNGVDMGSSSIRSINLGNIGLLFGESYSSLNIGEVWHFFEQDLHCPIQLLWDNEKNISLSNLETIVYPESNEKSKNHDKILKWVKQGGQLIVIGSSVRHFCESQTGISSKEKVEKNDSTTMFKNEERVQLSSMLGGAIYHTEIDQSNPLCYGLEKYFTLRLNASPYKLKKPAIWLNSTSEPTNGFVGYLVADNQKESSVSGRISYGKGFITYMIDNPLFRGFWYQGKLLFSNAIFFK